LTRGGLPGGCTRLHWIAAAPASPERQNSRPLTRFDQQPHPLHPSTPPQPPPELAPQYRIRHASEIDSRPPPTVQLVEEGFPWQRRAGRSLSVAPLPKDSPDAMLVRLHELLDSHAARLLEFGSQSSCWQSLFLPQRLRVRSWMQEASRRTFAPYSPDCSTSTGLRRRGRTNENHYAKPTPKTPSLGGRGVEAQEARAPRPRADEGASVPPLPSGRMYHSLPADQLNGPSGTRSQYLDAIYAAPLISPTNGLVSRFQGTRATTVPPRPHC
jgi:hypothetical protein